MSREKDELYARWGDLLHECPEAEDPLRRHVRREKMRAAAARMDAAAAETDRRVFEQLCRLVQNAPTTDTIS